MIEFFVPGIPRPAGSKRGFPIRRKGGKLGVAMADASGAAGKAWRVAVIAAVSEHWKEAPIDGPISLAVEFVMPRPASHFGKKKGAPYLKPNSPTWHTSKPDRTKLLRAIEDAMTGVVWRDDAQVVAGVVSKRYGQRPGAHVQVLDLGLHGHVVATKMTWVCS